MGFEEEEMLKGTRNIFNKKNCRKPQISRKR
jgi:hypothetical protein